MKVSSRLIATLRNAVLGARFREVWLQTANSRASARVDTWRDNPVSGADVYP
jgi:hypothetical protein